MVTIGMNYLVLPGKEKIFEDACAKVVETMKGIEGHEASSIYREVGDGEPAYLIVSRWQVDEDDEPEHELGLRWWLQPRRLSLDLVVPTSPAASAPARMRLAWRDFSL